MCVRLFLGEFMLTKLRAKIEAKKQERLERQEKFKKEQERLNKIYPTRHVFMGEYEKDIVEDDLKYTYTHGEYFLADGTHKDEVTTFIRLTGDNAENSNVKILQKRIIGVTGYEGDVFTVESDGVKYKISTHRCNSPYMKYLENDFWSLRHIIENIDLINTHRKYKERDLALQDKQAKEILNNTFHN